MGYYFRFFTADEAPLSLAAIDQGLRAADPAYAVAAEGDAAGQLTRGGELHAQIEIESPPDPEEIKELKEALKGARGRKRKRVVDGLDGAKTAVIIQVLTGGRDWDATLDALTPLWRWLFTTRDGLLQADGEGYYDRTGLVLEVE
jgi:hypothetical protein